MQGRAIATELNAVLRAWGAYFRVGNASRQFAQIDGYVRERLGLFLSKKTGRAGRRWGVHTVEFFRALGVYQLSGTVRWTTATPGAAR
ncbi:MAG: group II intron maturase-specific domain-containing protein [Chloroflexota bacterium]